VEFEIGNRREAREAGGAMCFGCTIPHRFVSEGWARLVSVVSPPTF